MSLTAGVVTRVDHAGEQVNCKDKSSRGFKGITWKENSRLRHVFAPVLVQLYKELESNGYGIKYFRSNHYQLNNSHIAMNSESGWPHIPFQKSNLKTIVKDRVITEDNAELLVLCETACENIYKNMVNERLASDFQGSIFTHLEKLNLVLNGEKS